MNWLPRNLVLALTLAVIPLPALSAPAYATPGFCGDPANFSGGTGVSGDPLLVSTEAQLRGISDAWYESTPDYSCSAKHFLQTADINLGNVAFRPISGTGLAEYAGTYDGGGKRISGLSITGNSSNSDQLVGLFGITLDATIKDLTVEGTVVGDISVGGLIGRMDGGLVSDVVINVDVSGGYEVGGVVGTTLRLSAGSPVLQGVVSTGTVTGLDLGTVGGFPTPQAIGGIAGNLFDGSIREAVVNGNVLGPLSGTRGGIYGGVAGQVVGSGSYGGAVERSQVNGDVVAAEAAQVGGLVGKLIDNALLDNSASRGSVTGGADVGGLVGLVVGVDGDIDDSLATDAVVGTSHVGGSVGYVSSGGSGAGLVWDSTVNSTLDGVGVGALTPSTATIAVSTVQAKSLSTYVAAGWSISQDWTANTTWGICPGTSVNDGYPYLHWRYATDPCPYTPPAPDPNPAPGPSPEPTPAPAAETEVAVAPAPVLPPEIPNPSAVTAQELATITPAQIALISPQVFREIPAAAMAALTPAQASALTPAQVNSIRPAKAAELQPAVVAALSPEQVTALRPAAVARIQVAAIAEMSGYQVQALRIAAVAALEPEQVRALTPSAISQLRPPQIKALSTAQVAALLPSQLRALTIAQINVLSSRQLAGLSAEQRRALGR